MANMIHAVPKNDKQILLFALQKAPQSLLLTSVDRPGSVSGKHLSVLFGGRLFKKPKIAHQQAKEGHESTKQARVFYQLVIACEKFGENDNKDPSQQ